MKCPYQKIIIRMSETFAHPQEDSIIFNNCLGDDCPFYYIRKSKSNKDGCKRADKEVIHD